MARGSGAPPRPAAVFDIFDATRDAASQANLAATVVDVEVQTDAEDLLCSDCGWIEHDIASPALVDGPLGAIRGAAAQAQGRLGEVDTLVSGIGSRLASCAAGETAGSGLRAAGIRGFDEGCAVAGMGPAAETADAEPMLLETYVCSAPLRDAFERFVHVLVPFALRLVPEAAVAICTAVVRLGARQLDVCPEHVIVDAFEALPRAPAERILRALAEAPFCFPVDDSWGAYEATCAIADLADEDRAADPTWDTSGLTPSELAQCPARPLCSELCQRDEDEAYVREDDLQDGDLASLCESVTTAPAPAPGFGEAPLLASAPALVPRPRTPTAAEPPSSKVGLAQPARGAGALAPPPVQQRPQQGNRGKKRP